MDPKVTLRHVALLIAASTLGAQAPAEGTWGVSIGVLGAYGAGNLSRDTDAHPGFGLHLGAVYHPGGRQVFRPAFEWTGYRIGPYNAWERAASSILDSDYRENRVVFRTYRLGLDYLVHQDPEGRSGPYLLLGCGGQLSHLYSDRRYVDGQGNETIEASASRGSHTSLWIAAGLGYQGRSGGMAELRFSRADYAAEAGATGPVAGGPLTREGYAFTLVLGGRF